MPQKPREPRVSFFSRRQLEEAEDRRLAIYASRSSRAVRRLPVPEEGRTADYRTEYQRDRDRIVHSKAFRRLKHKTQVFIPFEGDHYRTRLTHTLEATQVARTFARALNLNEDLAEACALAHDVGHTPFGHSGEKALNRILAGAEPAVPIHPDASRAVGAFKHNYQSLRVVDLLEKRYEHPGLNLTGDTREGILKHTAWKRDFPFPVVDPGSLHLSSGGHLEGQAVGWADEIAQQAHDLEDGLPLVEEGKILSLRIARAVVAAAGPAWDAATDRTVRNSLLVRGMIHLLVTDVIEASCASIERWLAARKVSTPDEFYAQRHRLPGSLVAPTRDGEKLYLELKEFIYQKIIHSHSVAQHDGRAQHILQTLFAAFYKNPRLLPDYVLLRYRDLTGVSFLRDIPLKRIEAEIAARYHRNPQFVRAIADHLAGMTDSYAVAVYDTMVSPYPRHSAGAPLA